MAAGGDARDMGAPGFVRAGFEFGGDGDGAGTGQRLIDGGEEDGRADDRAGPGKGKVSELEQLVGGAAGGSAQLSLTPCGTRAAEPTK